MKTSVYIGIAAITASIAVNWVTADSGNQKKPSGHSGSAAEENSTGQKIAFAQLPAAVQKTMRAEAGNLNIENTRKVTQDGQTS